MIRIFLLVMLLPLNVAAQSLDIYYADNPSAEFVFFDNELGLICQDRGACVVFFRDYNREVTNSIARCEDFALLARCPQLKQEIEQVASDLGHDQDYAVTWVRYSTCSDWRAAEKLAQEKSKPVYAPRIKTLTEYCREMLIVASGILTGNLVK